MLTIDFDCLLWSLKLKSSRSAIAQAVRTVQTEFGLQLLAAIGSYKDGLMQDHLHIYVWSSIDRGSAILI